MVTTRRCINCRVNPPGPLRVGVTPSGHRFMSDACLPCQAGVDRAILQLVARRFPEAAFSLPPAHWPAA